MIPILVYKQNGKSPYETWLKTISDKNHEAAILSQINKFLQGDRGHIKSIGDGLWEIKIDKGPGYRVYFSVVENQMYILGGSNKKNQTAEISNAKNIWKIQKDALTLSFKNTIRK